MLPSRWVTCHPRRFSTTIFKTTMLEQCLNKSKQYRSNVATLWCAENRRCKSSLVTSRLSSVLSFLTLERVSFAILMSFSAVLMASRAAAWLPAAFTSASVILTMTSDTALAFALKTEKRKKYFYSIFLIVIYLSDTPIQRLNNQGRESAAERADA